MCAVDSRWKSAQNLHRSLKLSLSESLNWVRKKTMALVKQSHSRQVLVKMVRQDREPRTCIASLSESLNWVRKETMALIKQSHYQHVLLRYGYALRSIRFGVHPCFYRNSEKRRTTFCLVFPRWSPCCRRLDSEHFASKNNDKMSRRSTSL